MTADETHEALKLFPTYSTLVQYLRPGIDALAPETSPGDLVGVLAWHPLHQTGCLIVAHCPWVTDDVWEAAGLVQEVREMCERNRRPRYLAEMGHTIEDVLGGPNDG